LKPLIIEFAGLPGAGKTTTAESVVAQLQARGLDCAYRPSLVGIRGGRTRHRLRFLWFRIRHWRLIVAAIAYALSIRPRRWARIRTVEHLVFLAYYQSEQRQTARDIVVVDQSVVQTMWSTCIHGETPDGKRSRALLERFQRVAGGVVVLVVVDIDPDTAASRVVEREPGWWRARFDRLPVGEVKSVFAKQRDALHLLAEQAISTARGPGITVDGTHSPTGNAARIAAFLEGLLQQSPTAAASDVPTPTADSSSIVMSRPASLEMPTVC
jgi:thymidylate kinase